MAFICNQAAVLGLSATLLLALNPAVQAQTVPAQEQAGAFAQVSGTEREHYFNDLKRRHSTQDERTALLAESNQLLSTYALTAGYRIDQVPPNREDLLYRLSVDGTGELLVREQRQAPEGGAFSVRNQRVELFGVDPFVRYDCPPDNRQSCVLYNPKDGSEWLTIVRNPQGAQQLARALGFLIRNLQKG